MSFGFSVGDVILLSQLSLQIYQTCTAGRKNATRDLQELSEVLFGFQCALDHLSNVAGEISRSSDSSQQGSDAEAGMRRRLDQMVKNCATTLENLDSATRKYREGAQKDAVEIEEAPVNPDVVQRANLKQRIASNVWKIRWDMDKDTLKIYRDKLQSHTDAINLVVNTFVWSTTHKIYVESKANAEQFASMHDNVVASNAELSQLLKSLVATHQSKSSPSLSQASVSPHFVSSEAAEDIPKDASAMQQQQQPAVTKAHHLPPDIQALNAKRMAYVLPRAPTVQAIVASSQQAQASRPVGPLSVEQLLAELSEILPVAAIFSSSVDGAKVTQWVYQLDAMLDSRIWSGAAKKDNQDLIDIAVSLNEAIEYTDEKKRAIFYERSKAANVDFILAKIATATHSVRASKELEEFVETRESWEEA